MELSDFPGGPVVGCLPAKAGDMGLTLCSRKIPHTVGD